MTQSQIIKIVAAGWLVIFGIWPIIDVNHTDEVTTFMEMIDNVAHAAGVLYLAYAFITYHFGEKEDGW